MPQKTQTISVTGFPKDKVQALVFGTFESLNWNSKYAAEDILIAYTPKSWKKYDHEITVNTSDSGITITSKMIHGEAWDLMGRNKKFLDAFSVEFGKISNSANDQQIETWREKVVGLKGATLRAAQEEIREHEKIENVMHLSTGSMKVTFGIIGINVLVFLAMIFSGISFIEPSGQDIIRWGANYSPLTLSGDWWRLITCVFVHIGIIHLLFNMYALVIIGRYLEPMLGQLKFLTAYLATGIIASLASIWWHSEPIPSAGASGAIFGMYGVFLALLSTNLIPAKARNKLLVSIGIFVFYNLVYGMKSGIDNAAHIGGLLSGIVIGYLYFLSARKEKDGRKNYTASLLISALTASVTFLYLSQHKTGTTERNNTIQTLSDLKFKDAQKFMDQYNRLVEIQDHALIPLRDTTQLMDESFVSKLDSLSLPQWNLANELANEMKAYEVSENYRKKLNLMEQYIRLRIQQAGLFKKYVNENDPETEAELNTLAVKLNSLVDELNAIQL